MGTKEVPIKEAVRIGYNSNSTLIKEGSADRFKSDRDFNLSKATKALEAAGFDVTPIEGSPYEFLVTKKAKSSSDAETQATPSSLDNLGIDFQSATMDASGTRLPTPGAFTGRFQKIMEGAKNWKEVAKRLKGETVTYFDFETTGIADYDGQDITNDPVQLGAVQVKDGKIVKRFNVYINPESKLSEWSSKNLGRDVLDENGDRILDENGKPTTTPVTPEWLAEQAGQEQALRDFIDFIGPNALLGGQNVPFDVEILKRMADKYGIELDIAGTIDSKDLASLLPKYDPEKGIDGPKAPDRKTGEIKATSSLGPVANFLGFEPANWHSADGDAEDSYNLVSKIIDRAAKEENQDLSLLDFPLMQKRYAERMAEFKSVVDPSNPITDAQTSALQKFTESDNPDIAQKATDALASATTRGDAANALADIHAQESLPSITVSESAAESSRYNADESDSDFSPEVSENEGPSSQKLVMPKPEDGGSNKTVEASTLSRKIKSLKESIASGEDIQNSRRSRGKEEDPDVAKFLDRDYKELMGLEFIEAYRKQTGKDRVSAPRSVFEGTHPMFEENPSSITVSESEGPESSGTQAPQGPEFNSDESDSDFDDVEVEFNVPKATAAPDYSVTTSAIDDLIEKYGPTIATTQEVNEYTLIKLGMLVNEVNDAAENYKQTQDAGDKKLYMDKLLEMLDLRSGIIHTANAYSLSNRDSVADSKISGDPLLSPSELALINSRITPRLANGGSFTPTGPVSKRGEQLRREASVKTMTQFLAGLAAKDAKAPKISGLPENWKPYGLVQAFDEALSRKNNLDKIGAIREALKKVQLWENDAVVSFRDSTGAYPGVLRVGKGKSSGLAATPSEIRTIVASVSNFGDKIDMNVGSASHYDMFITPSGGAKDHPLRRLWVEIGMMRKSKPTTLAYSSELTGTVFYMDKIRNSQKDHDSGASKNDGKSGSWWAIEIRPKSSDVLDSTINHEFGHATHDAAFIDTSQEMSGKTAPSRYGAENNNEKFAEYMSKYIRTGDAPPWFIDLLRSKGLLKSQQN